MAGQVRRRSSTWARALLALPVVMAVAGCSMLPGTGPNAAAAAAPAQCAGVTAEAALEKWWQETTVPEPTTTLTNTLSSQVVEAVTVDDSGFDPCAALSWASVTTDLPGDMDLTVAVLFHHGQYVSGDHTAGAYLAPTFTRVADGTVRVEFFRNLDASVTDVRDGQQVLQWDEARQVVTTSGSALTMDDLYSSISDADFGTFEAELSPFAQLADSAGELDHVRGTESEVANESLSASETGRTGASRNEQSVSAEPTVEIGGRRPAGATRIRTVKNSWRHESGVIVTPSGNIRCEFDETGWAGCGADSYYETRKYGTSQYNDEPNWWIVFDGADEVVPEPHWDKEELDRMPPQVIEYGEVAYYDKYVCLSEQRGLSCWNENTGDGLFLNREGYKIL